MQTGRSVAHANDLATFGGRWTVSVIVYMIGGVITGRVSLFVWRRILLVRYPSHPQFTTVSLCILAVVAFLWANVGPIPDQRAPVALGVLGTIFLFTLAGCLEISRLQKTRREVGQRHASENPGF